MFEHDPNDVSPYWSLICKHVLWPSTPKTCHTFWQKVESCALLTVLCENTNFELRVRHALMFQLTQLWMAGCTREELQAGIVQTGRRGRPKHADDVLWEVCQLDLIMHFLLGPPRSRWKDPQRQQGDTAHHWAETLKLLAHFFPKTTSSIFPDRRTLRRRVNDYLRRHRSGVVLYESHLDTLCRSSWFTTDACQKLL